MFRTTIILATLFVCAANVTSCSSDEREVETVVAFKNAEGVLDELSANNLKLMKKDAAEHGQISVWVAFDMAYEGNPELRSAEVIESEAAERDELVETIVGPLERGELAWLAPTPQGTEQASGVLVDVTADGLDRLFSHARVRHLSYMRSAP